MTLNNRIKQNQGATAAQLTLIDTIKPGFETLTVSASMNVLTGAAQQFQFAIPNDFEVTDVATTSLSKWYIAEENAQRKLVVELREVALAKQVVSMVLVRANDYSKEWSFPSIKPLQVDRINSLLLLRSTEDIALSKVQYDHLLPVDSTAIQLDATLNTTDSADLLTGQSVPTSASPNANAPLQIRSAFYAPGEDYSWTANVSVSPSNFNTTVRSSSRQPIMVSNCFPESPSLPVTRPCSQPASRCQSDGMFLMPSWITARCYQFNNPVKKMVN